MALTHSDKAWTGRIHSVVSRHGVHSQEEEPPPQPCNCRRATLLPTGLQVVGYVRIPSPRARRGWAALAVPTIPCPPLSARVPENS